MSRSRSSWFGDGCSRAVSGARLSIRDSGAELVDPRLHCLWVHRIYELPDRDRIAWTRLINGYVRSGRAREAVDLFLGMMEANVRPDEVSIVAACTSCSQLSPAPSPLVLVWVLFARGGKYT
ncbi:hypothetical protein OPV22_007971 [Ensete ventricosum]|uniref:Pentatricopeptide repeat-containing protein n=1 Tax=Ensete ventricosum TaxID=4639 RepID=A0AAV8R780_ENSVE|nr:hypothetical protein OPV22_007971 [Ensete ventricosum]